MKTVRKIELTLCLPCEVLSTTIVCMRNYLMKIWRLHNKSAIWRLRQSIAITHCSEGYNRITSYYKYNIEHICSYTTIIIDIYIRAFYHTASAACRSVINRGCQIPDASAPDDERRFGVFDACRVGCGRWAWQRWGVPVMMMMMMMQRLIPHPCWCWLTAVSRRVCVWVFASAPVCLSMCESQLATDIRLG